MELLHFFFDGLHFGHHALLKLKSSSSDLDPELDHVINNFVIDLQFLVQVRPDKWLREMAVVEVLHEIDNPLLLLLASADEWLLMWLRPRSCR